MLQLFGKTNIFRQTGDLLHLASVVIVLYKMLRLRNCTGLSLKSQFAYAVVFTARYLPTMLPLGNQSVYLLSMKLFFLLSSWFIVYLMRFKNPWRASYDPKADSFKVRYVFLVAFVMSIFFHYDNPHLFVEVLWTYSQYLEACAILPQLLLLNTIIEQGRKWELLTVHYVLCLGLYRLFYVINWVYRYFYESRWNWVDTTSGVIQTLLYADFFYTYFQGMSRLRERLP
eukprot:Rhum_TRINITY_DN2711_c0_g1::Rhum_TRINITY_DN2711_c0_g1_i1::g.8078::m.8078/K10949/KDELR; ER lumen protein retaining receptor